MLRGGRSRTEVPPRTLLRNLRRALSAAGSKERAAAMRAYMKSKMPFHGVPAPEARRIVRRIFSGVSFRSAAAWRSAIDYLWRHARFREERYAVVALARSPASRPFRSPAALPLYRALIRSGAWWDLVDEIAIHCVGPILRVAPRVVAPRLRAWSHSPDLWLRRASIICQVGSRDRTDRDLLADCIAPSLPATEFFLRKSIGWALRQYARTSPGWVRAYVQAHEQELSPLSRREALRHLELGRAHPTTARGVWGVAASATASRRRRQSPPHLRGPKTAPT